VRAGIDAVDDVDLFLADQTLDFVDRDIGLALRVGIDRRDLVLAADAAALVAEVNCNLRADRASAPFPPGPGRSANRGLGWRQRRRNFSEVFCARSSLHSSREYQLSG
jgi:hypothetical protein